MKKFNQFFIIFFALSGALNWVIIALLNLNVVAISLGEGSFLVRVVYLLMGLAGLYLLLHLHLSDYIIIKENVNQNKVTDKQIIKPDSPLIKEQEDFINEGGNSQPLKKDDF